VGGLSNRSEVRKRRLRVVFAPRSTIQEVLCAESNKSSIIVLPKSKEREGRGQVKNVGRDS
jgi:hypothetical protein